MSTVWVDCLSFFLILSARWLSTVPGNGTLAAGECWMRDNILQSNLAIPDLDNTDTSLSRMKCCEFKKKIYSKT